MIKFKCYGLPTEYTLVGNEVSWVDRSGDAVTVSYTRGEIIDNFKRGKWVVLGFAAPRKFKHERANAIYALKAVSMTTYDVSWDKDTSGSGMSGSRLYSREDVLNYFIEGVWVSVDEVEEHVFVAGDKCMATLNNHPVLVTYVGAAPSGKHVVCRVNGVAESFFGVEDVRLASQAEIDHAAAVADLKEITGIDTADAEAILAAGYVKKVAS